MDCDIHASTVVSSPHADERLWSEVLWRGAYDLLVEPHESREVHQTVTGALRAVRPARLAGLRKSAASGGRTS